LYLWERCCADALSIKRACGLALLLSFSMLPSGAYPTYFLCYDNSKLSGSYCLIVTGERLLEAVSCGLGLSIILLLMSNFFERALAYRMSRWKYMYNNARWIRRGSK
jgi:hypothetical protein